MKRIKKFSYSKSFYILVSTLFALILFFNANAIQLKNTNRSIGSMETYSATISDVPIQFNYDSDKYFISDFDSYAAVYLTSYNQIRLDAEKSKDTRSFSLVADLTNTKEGTFDVPIRIQDLSSGVNGQVDPASVTVTVEKKATQDFDIKTKVDEKLIPEGYRLGNVSINKSEAKVLSGAAIIAKIDHVEASLPSDVVLNENYVGKVTLQAVDKDGKVLPATIKPENVEMKVEIKKPEKEVPLVGEVTGTIEKGFSDLEYEFETKKVKVIGDYSDIDSIEQITVPIDATGITKEKTIEVPISETSVNIEPSKIKVKVKPIK